MDRQTTVDSKLNIEQSNKGMRQKKSISAEAPLNAISQLQQSFGNRALYGILQAKLKVSQPDNVYELEADKVAEQIANMQESKSGDILKVQPDESVQDDLLEIQACNIENAMMSVDKDGVGMLNFQGKLYVVDSWKLLTIKEQFNNQLSRTLKFFRKKIIDGMEYHRQTEKTRDESFVVSRVSDVFSLQSFPELSIWDLPFGLVDQAYGALKNSQFRDAAVKIKRAADEYRKAYITIYEYTQGTDEGAGRAVYLLEAIRDLSFATAGILATVLTGGVGGAVIGTAVSTTGTIVQQGTEQYIGLRQEIDWSGIAFDTFLGLFLNAIAGKIGESFMGWALKNKALTTPLQKALEIFYQDIISGKISTYAHIILRSIFDNLRGSKTALSVEGVFEAIKNDLLDPRSYLRDLLMGEYGRRLHGASNNKRSQELASTRVSSQAELKRGHGKPMKQKSQKSAKKYTGMADLDVEDQTPSGLELNEQSKNFTHRGSHDDDLIMLNGFEPEVNLNEPSGLKMDAEPKSFPHGVNQEQVKPLHGSKEQELGKLELDTLEKGKQTQIINESKLPELQLNYEHRTSFQEIEVPKAVTSGKPAGSKKAALELDNTDHSTGGKGWNKHLGDQRLLTGKDIKKANVKQETNVGSPGTGPTGKSGSRVGTSFNLFDAAEVALSLRKEYSSEHRGHLRSVEFEVPSKVGNEGTRDDRFGRDSFLKNKKIQQPSHDDYTGLSVERGHGAAQQLSGGDPVVAAALMVMTNVWPMRGKGPTGVNQGAYKAFEDSYIKLKMDNPNSTVRVKVVAVIKDKPTFIKTQSGKDILVPDAFETTVTFIPHDQRPITQTKLTIPNT